MIQHANGFITKYAHTSLIQVKVGDRVEQGQVIGYVGNSGRTTGSHLHYEVILGDKHIDPMILLK
jgi:murein DD-endopeptidase MepM/ murein hydrolase activator NlpD